VERGQIGGVGGDRLLRIIRTCPITVQLPHSKTRKKEWYQLSTLMPQTSLKLALGS
jgi:hypothetical protein